MIICSGYRGIVKVNGRTFRGTQVCNSKKTAHQEVAKIALEYMKSLPETTETSSSISSSTSSSSKMFFLLFLQISNLIMHICAKGP